MRFHKESRKLFSLGLPSVATLSEMLIGPLFPLFVGARVPYARFCVKGSPMALALSAMGAVFLIFFLTDLINPLLKWLLPGNGLHPGEVLRVIL